MALAAVFLFRVFFFHLPVVPVPGRARLLQPLQLVVVAAVERERPALSLVDPALRPQILRHLAELPVDEIQMADLRHVARVHLRRQAEACRIVDAEVPCHALVAEFGLPHPAQHLAPRLIFVLAADHVLTAQVHLGTVMRV